MSENDLGILSVDDPRWSDLLTLVERGKVSSAARFELRSRLQADPEIAVSLAYPYLFFRDAVGVDPLRILLAADQSRTVRRFLEQALDTSTSDIKACAALALRNRTVLLACLPEIASHAVLRRAIETLSLPRGRKRVDEIARRALAFGLRHPGLDVADFTRNLVKKWAGRIDVEEEADRLADVDAGLRELAVRALMTSTTSPSRTVLRAVKRLRDDADPAVATVAGDAVDMWRPAVAELRALFRSLIIDAPAGFKVPALLLAVYVFASYVYQDSQHATDHRFRGVPAAASGLFEPDNALIRADVESLLVKAAAGPGPLEAVGPFIRIPCEKTLADMILMAQRCEGFIFSARAGDDSWLQFLILQEFGEWTVVSARWGADRQTDPAGAFVELLGAGSGSGSFGERDAALRQKALDAVESIGDRAWQTRTMRTAAILAPMASGDVPLGGEADAHSPRVQHLLDMVEREAPQTRIAGRVFSVAKPGTVAAYNRPLKAIQRTLRRDNALTNSLGHELVHAAVDSWPLERKLRLLIEGNQYLSRHPTLEGQLEALYGTDELTVIEESVAFLVGSFVAGERWIVFFQEANLIGAGAASPLPFAAYPITSEDVATLTRLGFVATSTELRP
jgi:hypothetical protein